MTQFLENNLVYIIIGLFVITFVLLGLILSMNRYLTKYFSNKRFKIISSYEVNAKDGNKNFSISIYNNNINEIRLSGFGYIYKNQSIDFYNNYLQEHGLHNDQKIVILSRDYLSTKIDVNQLKSIIADINKGSLKIRRIKAFVTDSLGFTTVAKTIQVQDQLLIMIKNDREILLSTQKEQMRKLKEEKRLYRLKERIERKIKIQEKFSKVLLKIKALFTKKH